MDGLWATKSELSVQLVSKISNLCDPDPPTSQTDGQTCNLNTALCTSGKKRGKKEKRKEKDEEIRETSVAKAETKRYT